MCSTDSEVFAGGGGIAFDAVGHEVGGDGAGVVGKSVPEPAFDRVALAGLERGAQASAGAMNGAVYLVAGE